MHFLFVTFKKRSPSLKTARREKFFFYFSFISGTCSLSMNQTQKMPKLINYSRLLFPENLVHTTELLCILRSSQIFVVQRFAKKIINCFYAFFVAQPFKRRSPSLKTTRLFNIYLECIFLQPVAKYFCQWCNKVIN